MLLRFASVRIFQMASGVGSSHTFPEFFSLIKGFALSPIASAFRLCVFFRVRNFRACRGRGGQVGGLNDRAAGAAEVLVNHFMEKIFVLYSRDVPDIRHAISISIVWPDTGYVKPDIQLSKRPDIRPNTQLGLYKHRSENFFLLENTNVKLFTIVYLEEQIRS